jgi:nucleoside-diphosphate-sugar epimerase
MRPVYVEDVAALAAALAYRGQSRVETWVAAGAQAVSFQELVERIAARLGKNLRCLPLTKALVGTAVNLANGVGLRHWAQRLDSWQMEKLWFDDAVWKYLEGEPTDLESGLQRSIECYLADEGKSIG